MKRKLWVAVLSILMIVAFVPAAVFAETTPTATYIYVSESGDDSGAGTQEKPYATLAKAVREAEDGATICVMSNLTMTECARYYNKDLTITSLGDDAFTVTRGEAFSRQQDDARSTYNPAMIEVQGNKEGAKCGLTLTNIILDDAAKHEGTVFAQAISGDDKSDNTVYVQDAMIASNATVPCTITLGDGAALRNFGGMSAVRVTDKAQLIMEKGSAIEDTTVTDRVKGDSGSVGPAGAVWVQGASVEMKSGSEISNVVGRAVYVDGGKAEIGGTISGIKGDEHMWQGDVGTVLHLRNGASAEFSGKAENCTGGTMVIADKATFEMKQGSLLGNSDAAGIKTNEDPNWNTVDKSDYGTDRNIITINGEITGIKNNKNPIQFKYGTLTIGEYGNIHDNAVYYGALYIQRDAVVNIYGKINNNSSTGRGGAIGLPGHGYVEINLYKGAELKNNVSKKTGGGANLNNCKFVMYDGEISGNSASLGGGLYLNSDATAEIRGGRIEKNTTLTGENNNIMICSSQKGSITRYLYISEDAYIDSNSMVNMELGQKTIAPGVDSKSIKFYNASTDSNKALEEASNGKGWNTPLATFWMQRSGAATLIVGGLNDKIAEGLPVYAMVLPVDEKGNPEANAQASVYATEVTEDGIRFTVPEGNDNGYAVALVQPDADYGNVIVTTTKAELDKDKDKNAEGKYEIPYTATYKMSESLKNVLKNAAETSEQTLDQPVEQTAEEATNRITEETVEVNSDENAANTSEPAGNETVDETTAQPADDTSEQSEELTPEETPNEMGTFYFTIELDKRLAAKNGYTLTSAIFEAEKITESADGHTVTAKCKLKDDWQKHIDDPDAMVLSGTGVLVAADFAAGDSLNSTANVQATVDSGKEILEFYVPGNVCKTSMVATDEPDEPVVDPTDPENPSNPGDSDNPGTVDNPGEADNQGDAQDSGNADEDAPKTGDETPMELLIGLFMLTVISLAGIVFLRRSSIRK